MASKSKGITGEIESIAKKWALANGYKGATGGWIYKVIGVNDAGAPRFGATCGQGWYSFAVKKRPQIAEAIAAGTIVASEAATEWFNRARLERVPFIGGMPA